MILSETVAGQMSSVMDIRQTDGLREQVIYREAPHPKLCWFESHEPAPQHAASGTGCSGKIVFFHNSLQPLPLLHRCKKPSKLSTQCECTVTPIGW